MIEAKRFLGVLNTDDKVQDVVGNQHIDAKNIRFIGGQNGLTAENIKGNYLIDNNDLPAGTNHCVGAFFDQLNNRIIWFNYNSNGDNGIYELNIATESVTPIFICGTNSATDILNFNLDYPIHSVNIVYRDAGDLLYWTDGYNRPRYLNIDSTSISSLSPFTEVMINAAKQPPLIPPSQLGYGSNAAVFYNNVYNKYFRFAYRWVYANGEKSTFSPTSECPIALTTDPTIPIPPNTNNFITINNLYSATTEDFVGIELYGQQYNGSIWEDFFLIDTLDKGATPLPYVASFDFYNDSAYLPILPTESDLRFDRLPDLANTLELLNGNVLIYGGITEGYDLIPRTSIDVQVTVTLSNSANTYPSISPVWRWGQNERFGIVYYDQYGKTNGVISYLNNPTDSTNFDITTPEYVGENVGLGIATPRISASINHLPPSWAVSYQWVRQDISPTFFLQYVTNDYQTDADYFYLGIEGLAYNNSQGFVPAYDFAPGDRVKILGKFISSNQVITFGILYDFEIYEVVSRPMQSPPNVAAPGSYLKIKKLGGAPPYDKTMLVEIYTPNQISRSEVIFYEWGQQYGIYEIAGVKYHLGDTQNQTALQPALFVWDNGPFYVKSRNFPLRDNYTLGVCGVIDRNFNDFTPSRANSNSRGWAIEENSKREYLSASVRWGGAYAQDETTNELNRFYPGDIDTVDRTKGDIRRFKSRERILRVFQDRGVGQYGVFTRYIQNNSGSNELVTTNEIITANNIQYYMGNYGLCGYPTNLVSSQKSDYFTDVITGRSVRLSSDGVTDLGLLYKGQYFLSDLVTPYNTTILKYDGTKSKVMGFYDFYDDQYHIVLEGQGQTCESYTVTKIASSILPTIVYYTDCDGVAQSHTVLLEGDVFNFCALLGTVDITTDGGGALELTDNGIGGCSNPGPLAYNWSFNERRNAFCSFYDYHPEWAIGANDMIYTWLNGQLWKHDNTNQYCSFYGNPANVSVTAVFNNNLLIKKSWNSINEIATDVWEVPEMYTNSYSYGTPGFGPPAPQVQESNLVAAEFTFLEGNPSSAIKRDVNSPGGKINGNFMKGNYLVLKLQKTSAQSLVTLSEISVRFTESPLTAK